MAMCCATSSTIPLWAQEWDNPELPVIDPNLTPDEVTGGGLYYIYHPATGMFLTNGNDYDTRLSVGETGQEITLAYGTDRGLVRSDPDYASVKGWILNMMNATSNSGFHEVYITSTSSAYVDCNLDGHMLWNITKQDNGYYRIQVVDEDPLYGATAGTETGAGGYMAVNNPSAGTTIVTPVCNPLTAGFETADGNWQFVEPEAYEAYRAKLENLKPALENAVELGFTDYGQYEEIYNSQTVTADEVTEAVSQLTADIVAWQAGSASEASPADVTYLVSDADFSNEGSGWTLTNMNGDLHNSADIYEDPDDPSHYLNYFLESWVSWGSSVNDNGRVVSAYYTIASMPAGKYRLSADCFGVIQSGNATMVDQATGVYLTAEADGVQRTAEAHTLEFYGDSNDRPVPRPVSIDFYVSGGSITVGFKAENSNCNWVGFDNVKLEYMGEQENGMAAELSQAIADAQAVMDQYTEELAVFSLAGETAFYNTMASASEAVANTSLGDEELAAILAAVYEQVAALTADVDAYNRMDTEIMPALETMLDESAYADEGLPLYEDYLDELYASLSDRTFDPAQVDSVQSQAEEVFVQAVRQEMEAGNITDVTGLGTNMNFTNGSTGWTHEGDGTFNCNQNVAEVWQGSVFDVYQELTGLPEGTYRITMQGYNRPGSNASIAPDWDPADPRATVNTYFYGNDTQAKLPHLYEKLYDSADGIGGVVSAVGGTLISGTGNTALDGKYVCDGTTGAELAFQEEGAYEESLLCYVTEAGALRLGVKTTQGTNSDNWALFDNFRVEYVGADMTGYVSAVQGLIDQANLVLADDGITTLEAQEALLAAITEAMVFVADPSDYDRTACEALVASLNAAIELGNTTLETVLTLDELATEEDRIISETDDYASFTGTAEFEELVDLVSYVFDYLDGYEDFATLDEVNQWITDINDARSRMYQTAIDFTAGSLDSPVEVTSLIQNPSFQNAEATEDATETTLDGWTQSGAGTGDVDNARAAEIYNSADGYIYQTLYSLPQGYYRLTYSAFYRAGGYNAAAVARRDGEEEALLNNALAFARTESADVTKPLPSILDYMRGDKYISSDVVISDTIDLNDGLVYHCIPDKLDGARVAFEEYGDYADQFSFYVKSGETVQMGIRKEGNVSSDWVALDNFRLYYLGDGEAPDDVETAVDETVAEGTVTVVSTAWYTINGVQVAEPKQRGIYIRQDVMSDGSKKAVKVVVK